MPEGYYKIESILLSVHLPRSFLEIRSNEIVGPINEENRPKIGLFEFIKSCKNMVILLFFLNLVCKKNLYYLLYFYTKKFFLLRYEPKCSLPIRLQNFQVKYLISENKTGVNFSWGKKLVGENFTHHR